MDCVEKLFEELPDPKGDVDMDSDSATLQLTKILDKFSQAPASQDPDYQYLLYHAKMAREPNNMTTAYFRQQLAYLAVQKPVQRKDKSIKARKLKCFRWLALGKKAETYPFVRGPTSPPTIASTVKFTGLVSPTDCAACGKADVNMRCPDCNMSDDIFVVQKTVYCNKKCLQDHRNAHKRICEGRNMVYRAAILLDYIFMSLQESTYVYPLGKVYLENGIVYLIDNHWDRAGMTGRTVFFPFPARLLPSPDLRRALLIYGQSDEISLSLYPLITYLFRPMCKTIDQILIQSRNVIRPTCQLSAGRSLNICLYKHIVLRLTLKSNEEYVIDLTGAQYGWKEILAPWCPWAGLRASKLEMANFKPARGGVRAMISRNMLESYQQEVRSMVLRSIITELNRAVHVNPKYDSFNQILKTPVEDYGRTQREVMDMVRHKIYMLIKNEYYKESYRLWLGPGPDPAIKLADTNAKKLKKVWMSAKEFDRLKNSGADMVKVWEERIAGKLEENKTKEGD